MLPPSSPKSGRLAKTVFMTHYSMSDILGGRKFRAIASRQAGLTNRDAPQNSSSGDKVKDVQNPDEESDEADGGPQIASYILSASIGVEGHVTELPEPVTFTMRHIEVRLTKLFAGYLFQFFFCSFIFYYLTRKYLSSPKVPQKIMITSLIKTRNLQMNAILPSSLYFLYKYRSFGCIFLSNYFLADHLFLCPCTP